MGFLFTSQKKNRTVGIFDIGSGSVGGAIVQIPTDGKGVPVIIKSVRNDIKLRDNKNFNFDALMKEMVLTFNTTVSSLYYEKAGVPEEVYCTMASPWYLSETRVIKLKKEKPFTFTKRLADELIQKEIINLTETYKNKYGEPENIPELIEQNIMSVSLNGYVVDNPIDKKCQSLEMNMILSLAPKLYLDEMRGIISNTFHHSKVSFSSFTLATYLAVRDKYIKPDSYLLIDISGEVTDVGIVTGGILKSVLSFPFGKKTFFKYMCTKLEIELRDAKELFKLYSDHNLSPSFKDKVIPLLKSIENSWGEAFNQCISTLPRTLVLPSNIFLTADNDIKEWFAEALRNEDNIQPRDSKNKYTVITLDGPEFLNMCDIKEGTCDPFLMIESIAIMRKKNN